MSLNPTGELCARCGKVAEGLAMIRDLRLCHGDTKDPTCYMLSSWGGLHVERSPLIEVKDEPDHDEEQQNP